MSWVIEPNLACLIGPFPAIKKLHGAPYVPTINNSAKTN